MHRTAVRLLTTAAAVAALAVPAHTSWAATHAKWEGPNLDAARAACVYQHDQTDLEFLYQKEPTSIEVPNLVRRAGFMDYTDDACLH